MNPFIIPSTSASTTPTTPTAPTTASTTPSVPDLGSRFVFACVLLAGACAPLAAAERQAEPTSPTASGGGARGAVARPPAGPFTDHRGQKPGVTHHIKVADLPAAHATPSVDNSPSTVARPKNAWPLAPAGFVVQLYAQDLAAPRLLRTAPNGDVFVAESRAGRVRVLRGLDDKGRARQSEKFSDGLNRPFGIAFYPPTGVPRWVYVANTDQVVRFAYQDGDLRARGKPEVVVSELPSGGLLRGGGHWTRDVAFSLDGKKMYVSVGSHSNNDDVDDNPTERHRAAILESSPDGKGMRVYASGIRNPVGIAIQPASGRLWASVNERDELGDDLVPDYITHVTDGGFYGWPWFYIGGHGDPRHPGKHPELKNKVLVPDVLLQPHNASLQMTFYTGAQFPQEYKGDIFAAQHGSWNRRDPTGFEVIRVPLNQKQDARGDYQDFLTGFVTPDGKVWGRPVGVTIAKDGALLVSDDVFDAVWRVSYANPN